MCADDYCLGSSLRRQGRIQGARQDLHQPGRRLARVEGPAREGAGYAQRLGQVLLQQVQRRWNRRGRHKFRRRACRRGRRPLLQLGTLEVIARAGRLSVSEEGDGPGRQPMVRFRGLFVSPSTKYALGAVRCPTDRPGARDAHIGIHESFLAGVLAKGTGIDYAASHMPPRLPAVSTRLLLFRAGPVAACDSGRLPLSPGVFSLSVARRAQYYAGAGFVVLPGWATLFLPHCCPHLRCDALPVHNGTGAFSPWA